MGNFFDTKQCIKIVEFISEFDDVNFHLNPRGYITFHECRGQGFLTSSFNFDDFDFRKKILLPLDWNQKVMPLY